MEQNMEDLLGIPTPVKRGRGRPPKGTSTPKPPTLGENGEVIESSADESTSSRAIITDPIIHPYKIYISENSYTVTDKDKQPAALMEKVHGYYTTLGGALEKIARLKTTKTKLFSLKEYVNAHKKALDEFRSVFNF